MPPGLPRGFFGAPRMQSSRRGARTAHVHSPSSQPAGTADQSRGVLPLQVWHEYYVSGNGVPPARALTRRDRIDHAPREAANICIDGIDLVISTVHGRDVPPTRARAADPCTCLVGPKPHSRRGTRDHRRSNARPGRDDFLSPCRLRRHRAGEGSYPLDHP